MANHKQPLALLWKGIGQFVLRHPHYRILFGPVSVSARYSDEARRLLAASLQQHCGAPGLAAYVSPRHPLRDSRCGTGEAVADIDALDDRIASIEPDGKRLPVLLRQYLRLGARVLGFSLDPNFGGVLDALMLVDLVEVDPARLAHYLGRAQVAGYLARHHQIASPSFANLMPRSRSVSSSEPAHVRGRPSEAAA